MPLDDTSELLDLIYEAASVPELWPTVLDKLADIAGAAGTFLFTTDPKKTRMTSSESLQGLWQEMREGG